VSWRHGLQIEALDRAGSSVVPRWKFHRSFANRVVLKNALHLALCALPPSFKNQRSALSSQSFKGQRSALSSQSFKGQRTALCPQSFKCQRSALCPPSLKGQRSALCSPSFKWHRSHLSFSCKWQRSALRFPSFKDQRFALCSPSFKDHRSALCFLLLHGSALRFAPRPLNTSALRFASLSSSFTWQRSALCSQAFKDQRSALCFNHFTLLLAPLNLKTSALRLPLKMAHSTVRILPKPFWLKVSL